MKNTKNEISKVCKILEKFLLHKNKKYGDTALNPINIFSKNNAKEKLLARIDDKLSRIKNSNDLRKNDVWDLTGYLILLIINNNFQNNIKEIYD